MHRKRTIALTCLIVAIVGAGAEKRQPPSLLGGRIMFTPPPADKWKPADHPANDSTAAFVAENHEGAMALQVLPSDAQLSGQMAQAIVRQLRDNRRRAKQKMALEPKVERDPRFALRIHEKIEEKDKIADQLHLYRDLGPRIVMLTVSALVTKDGDPKPVHKAGEDVLLSAKWVKKK